MADSHSGPLVRTYSAPTVAECLMLAKKELGGQAIILEKKHIRKGGVLGRWGGKEMVEITFTVEPRAADSLERPESRVPRPSSDDLRANRTMRLNADELRGSRTLPPGPGSSNGELERTQLQSLELQIAALTVNVQNLVDAGKQPFVASPVTGAGTSAAASSVESYPGLMRQLLDAEVSSPLVRTLLESLPPNLPAGDAASELRTRLAERFLIAPNLGARPGGRSMCLMAFLGATGVGKTTTLVKLATRFALLEQRHVGLLTLDTQRIAAPEQLRTYGDIVRVPVRVAHDRGEMIKHLSEFNERRIDVVLLDTPGRSPNDMVPMSETARVFDGLGAVQKVLTVPATLAAREMENVVARFHHLMAPDALVLTKLDEATDNSCFGKLLNVQAKYAIPLAYITTGQRVPDDITLPDAHALAARLLGPTLF